MTHAELVKRAVRWLRVKRHVPVLSEMVGANEIPDAIGWRFGESTLIECKTSRADFLRDHKKWFRREGAFAMGRRRFYMAPAGLLDTSEMPKGWGLLDVHSRTVSVELDAEERNLQPAAATNEMMMLTNALRRCQLGIHYNYAIAKFDPYEHPSHRPPPAHWEAL